MIELLAWIADLVRTASPVWFSVVHDFQVGHRWTGGRADRKLTSTNGLWRGVHCFCPWVQSVEVESKAPTTVSIENQTVTTSDGRAVVVGVVARYRVTNVARLVRAFEDRDSDIDEIVRTVVAEEIARKRFRELIGELDDVSLAIRGELEDRLRSCGLRVLSARVVEFAAARTLRLFGVS